jgi:DNA-binding NtrC family response regulator
VTRNVVTGSNSLTRSNEIIGISPWAVEIRNKISKTAAYSSTVLVSGPSGTGKELIAREIHRQSARSDKLFVAVDCPAIPETLFSSHLFGHVAGAYTGARSQELGCFRAANGGTIFLDEIGELDSVLQANLLRVLQERTVTPLGSHREIPIDVRVIAATNRDLGAAVNDGYFRADLYYRLNVTELRTTALSTRREDIVLLARHILVKLAIHHDLPVKQLSESAVELLERHDWPGNVRQLENTLECAMVMSEENTIGADVICEVLSDIIPKDLGGWRSFVKSSEPSANASHFEASPDRDETGGAAWATLSDVEREHIQRTLILTNHNQSATARLLRMSRQALARKIEKYRLNVSRSKPGRPRLIDRRQQHDAFGD